MTKIIPRKQFRIKSNSDKGKVYTVECLWGSLWFCECQCSMMSGRECAHIKQIRNQMWLENLTK